jgi:hypothetical protein
MVQEVARGEAIQVGMAVPTGVDRAGADRAGAATGTQVDTDITIMAQV